MWTDCYIYLIFLRGDSNSNDKKLVNQFKKGVFRNGCHHFLPANQNELLHLGDVLFGDSISLKRNELLVSCWRKVYQIYMTLRKAISLKLIKWMARLTRLFVWWFCLVIANSWKFRHGQILQTNQESPACIENFVTCQGLI